VREGIVKCIYALAPFGRWQHVQCAEMFTNTDTETTPSLRPGSTIAICCWPEHQSVTDKLQRVMNAAARVVSGTKKYDRGLTHLLHSELQWLDNNNNNNIYNQRSLK